MSRPTCYSLLFATFALFFLTRCLRAHEDGTDHHHDEKPAEILPKGLVLPAIGGPKPWSEKPVFNDPRRFQIAIMTDRTGGHRPGIWEKGVRVVNLLRPEFVISVGDLIEGYSDDPKEIEGQWKEFLGFIDEMKMKFFFVPGNHDLSNPLMHKIWRQHFGREWYSFDYQGVHFMALSSEDTQDQIGSEQLKWIEADLEKNKDARWTLLFFHKPLWVIAEREIGAGNPDPTNWKKVENLLANRNHTVFAGHVHHYVQYDRNGRKYYHLATTGGGSQMRGVPYGEFDHVMWLTMEEDGPHTAIVMLDGVLAPETVNEKGIARFRAFLASAAIEVAPILIDSDAGFSSGRIDVRLTNGFDAAHGSRGDLRPAASRTDRRSRDHRTQSGRRQDRDAFSSGAVRRNHRFFSTGKNDLDRESYGSGQAKPTVGGKNRPRAHRPWIRLPTHRSTPDGGWRPGRLVQFPARNGRSAARARPRRELAGTRGWFHHLCHRPR
ncbi:MAG: metallophosphoesterase [Planctomycetota bacterium]